MEALNRPHDRGYKWLLSSREIFLQLLKSFIDQPWVNEIDEKEIRRTDKSFIAKDFQEKESDIVYEVNLHGQTVIFYVLVELQRKVDFSMPYRLLNYMSGIWQNYLNLLPREDSIGQKEFRLPAVIPIVIYNGEPSWTAVRSFRELLAGERLFGNNLLNFEYILIDVNRYKDGELLALTNTIGAAFLLDKNSRSRAEFEKLLKDLLESLKNTTESELIIFLRWMKYIIQPRLAIEQQEAFAMEIKKLDKEGVKKMNFANIEKTLDNIAEEGRQQGKSEASREYTLKLLSNGVSIEIISDVTGLSFAEIEALKKKLM